MGKLTSNLTGTGYLTPDLRAVTTTQVASSRALVQADSNKVLECTAGSITLTMPAGLTNFSCSVIPNGTTSIARSGGALLNGAGTTVTRTAAANFIFSIVPRASAVDSYVVSGS